MDIYSNMAIGYRWWFIVINGMANIDSDSYDYCLIGNLQEWDSDYVFRILQWY